jgi:hypothetical protein
MLRFSGRSGVLPCVLAAALAGCGGQVENQSKIPIAEAPQTIAQAVCPKAWTCCTATQLMGNQNAGTDEQSCEAKTTMSYQSSLSNVQHSQSLHRALYDGDQLDACLNNIRSYSCEMLATTNHFSGVTGCDSFIKPLVEMGGDCGNTFECIDSWCKTDANGANGKCTAFAQAGETCGSAQGDTPCGSGLVCDGTALSCYQPGATGDACTDDLRCASANCSIPTGATAGTCAPPPADQCFYASGCSTAGCRPKVTAVILLLLAVFAAVARRRKPRGRQGKVVALNPRLRPSCRA